MNRAAMRTQLQRTGLGSAAADVTSQDESLKAAYTWVWNAADWSFKKVDMAILTVTASDATPTMPADVGKVADIFDHNGRALRELDPDEFDRLFQPGVTTSARGTPVAYKVVGRIVTLGPTPDAARTFRWSYDRRISHFQADGVTVVAGPMDADTDLPLWPDDHHMLLVHHAAMVEHGIVGSQLAATMQDLRDDALEAMREDLVVERAPGRQWLAYRP